MTIPRYIWKHPEDTSENEKSRISLTHSPAVAKSRRERYKKAADMLLQWMNEDDDYDERVWPGIMRELTKSSMRCAGIR